MKLKLIREPSSSTTTLGKLYLDGVFFCYTLEDVVRPDPNPDTPQNEAKVWGNTAIPAGKYKVVITMSPRFKRRLPLLIGVPGFDGIRIHPGNTHRDTDGCILVGEQIVGESILQSRIAFNRLFEILDGQPNITIEIE
jgi:hypothetical protein